MNIVSYLTCIIYFLGDLQRGESVTCQCGNVAATVWRDRNFVYVMSSNSDPRISATVQRKDRDGTIHTVTCLVNVVE